MQWGAFACTCSQDPRSNKLLAVTSVHGGTCALPAGEVAEQWQAQNDSIGEPGTCPWPVKLCTHTGQDVWQLYQTSLLARHNKAQSREGAQLLNTACVGAAVEQPLDLRRLWNDDSDQTCTVCGEAVRATPHVPSCFIVSLAHVAQAAACAMSRPDSA